MYFSESSLTLFDVALAKPLHGASARIERANIYGVESLLPRDRFSGGLSGSFRLGWSHQWDSSLVSRQAFQMEGALGLTQAWGRDIDAFVLFGGGFGVHAGPYLYAKPSAGLIVRQVYEMKAVISISALHHGLGRRGTAYEARWTQSKYLSRQWTLTGSWGQVWGSGRRASEADLRLKHLF